FAYASAPLVLPQWVAYALYRWEMNIRMAAVLGFVGAGGLGQLLYFHLSIFQQAQASTVLLAMFALVFVVDAFSSRFRRGLAPAPARGRVRYGAAARGCPAHARCRSAARPMLRRVAG